MSEMANERQVEYVYTAILENRATLIRRSVRFWCGMEPELMNKQRAVGMLGPHELEGERIISVHSAG